MNRNKFEWLEEIMKCSTVGCHLTLDCGWWTSSTWEWWGTCGIHWKTQYDCFSLTRFSSDLKLLTTDIENFYAFGIERKMALSLYCLFSASLTFTVSNEIRYAGQWKCISRCWIKTGSFVIACFSVCCASDLLMWLNIKLNGKLFFCIWKTE